VLRYSVVVSSVVRVEYPAEMAPDHRRREIAAIFARRVLRLRSCAQNGLRLASGSLSGGLSMLVHYLLTRRKSEMAVGSKANGSVNQKGAVQEKGSKLRIE